MTAAAETAVDRLVSRKDAAELLGGICLKTVDRLIAEKRVRAVHIGRKVLIPMSSIQTFIKGRS